jgi:hypothetical protein
MEKIIELKNLIYGFNFVKGDYEAAACQLLQFSRLYEQSNISDAEKLREEFDPKKRLGWLATASSVLCKRYLSAEAREREGLVKIFFAAYSFDNMGFGYDSVVLLTHCKAELQNDIAKSKKIWCSFEPITTNTIAVKNLRNKIFHS